MPADKFERVKEICSLDAEFIALPDIKIPDFYHPYKRGAYRFQFACIDDRIDIHVVADAALQLKLAPFSTSATLVSHSLGDWCGDTDEDVLGKLRFPTLPNFVNAWLDLASQEHIVGTAEQFVFLMNAERLIDANQAIDIAWCESHVHLEASLLLVKALLRDRQLRINQSTWK